MMRMAAITTATLLALSVAGCGTSPGDRAISGAGIGAGVGAIGTAIGGGNVGTGAVVGAVAGGVIGAVTSPDDVYLGEPIWKKRCEERRRNGERVDCSHRPRD